MIFSKIWKWFEFNPISKVIQFPYILEQIYKDLL